MESKINRIIDMVRQLREDGAIANVVGNGGYTNAATPPGIRDGYDKVMGLTRRATIIGKGKFPGARTRWTKPLQ